MSTRRTVLLRALLGLALVVGCEEVVVNPIPVATVQVVPDSAELFVDESVQLRAELRDESGEEVAGREVTWSSDDEDMATVDATGFVVAAGSGLTRVRASAEGQSGSAVIVVLRNPRLELDRGSVAFSAIEGSGDPSPVQVGVSNGGDGSLTGLAVSIAYDGAGGWLDATLDSTAAPTSMMVGAHTGTLEHGTYSATVEVADLGAENSPVALDVTFQVQQASPTAPSGLQATDVSADAIGLGWTDNSDNETGFEIQRQAPGESGFTTLATPGPDVSGYQDGGVVADARYVYRIRACNEAGCSPFSNQAEATTPPLAPSDLTAQALDTTTVQLSWTDNSVTETEFRVERRLAGGSFALIATPGADTTTATDSGLEPGTDYEYRIRACNSSGCSGYTATAAVSTPSVPIPAAPSGLSAATVSADRIDLGWTDNSGDETTFEVERRGPGESQFTILTSVTADVATHSDTTVAEDGTYVYRVRACGAGGCSAYSNEASATTPPSVPSGLSATVVSAGEVDLSWSENSATETSFHVERRPAGGTFTRIATLGADVTFFSDTGVEADTEYGYRIRACNGSGCSDYTAEEPAVTPPVAPSGLTAAATSPTAVHLGWADNSATEVEFRIERGTGGVFAQVGTVPTDSTAFTDTTAQPGTAYEYRVRACNGGGCSTASGTAADTTPLLAPSSPSAAPTSPTTIDVGWTDNSDNETEFRIERSSGGSGYTRVGVVGADSTSYSDTGLTADSTYTYRIRACNAVSCSAYSPEVTATTGSAPTAPSGLTAVVVSAGRIDLGWTDNSSTEDEFRIERAVGAGSYATLATVGADVVTYSDTSTVEDTEYSYRVSACNGGACSTVSNMAAAVTPPTAPSGLAVATVSSSELDVDWNDNSATETEFRVERRMGTDAFAQVTTTGADSTSVRDAGLDSVTTYEYRVLACNSGGCSAPSDTAAGTTADVAPVAPDGLSATTVSGSRIDLSWADNSGNETEFRIQRSVNNAAFAEFDTTAADVTAYSDTTVSLDTEYAYRVLACNPDACSVPSGEAEAVTPPVTPTADSATAASDSRIDVRWTDNSATESSFRVERRTGTNAFVQVATQGASVTLYSDAGLSANTTYDYRIRACNSGGCSDYTDTLTATTLATPPPADPTDLSATLAGDQSSVSLSWTDNSTDEDEFRVQRSIDGGTFTQRATVGANTVSFTDTDITVDNLYTYRVEACGSSGCSGFTNEASAVTEPVAPSALDATTVSAGQVDLTWTDASDTEDEFQLERSVDGGAFSALGTAPADTHAFSDLTTVEDTEYTYRLAACNTTGCSAFSATATDTTPPSAASELSATAASDTEIGLSWTDNSTYETGFRIQRRTSGMYAVIDTVAAGVTAYSDAGLDPTTTYEYRVVACNASGCASPSAAASATTDAIPVPTAPSGVITDVVSAGQIDLGWTDNSDNETEFRVERSVNGGAFAALDTVPADTTTLSDTTTVVDTEYAYRVAACNSSGCSAFSASVATATPPTAASGLAVTVLAADRIDLSWADNSDTEGEFRIGRSVSGGAFVTLDTVPAEATNFSDTTTVADTEYGYRVAACNVGGCAAFSNTATGTTPPSSASELTAAAVSDTRIDLSWTDNSTTEDEFRIERSTDSGATFVAHDTVAAGVTGYSDTGLDPATTYHYRVLACSGSGCAPPSAAASATTDAIPAPSDLTASAGPDTAVALSWTDNSDTEDEFRIQRRVNGGAFAALDTVPTNTTGFSDTTTDADTEYGYRVAACDVDGCSAFSNTATDSTPPNAASDVSANAVSDTEIDLSWTDNSTYETEFRIQRGTDGTTFAAHDTVAASVAAFSDTGLDPATTYHYRVLACNAAGCAAPSAPDSATTQQVPAPAAPGSLSAAADSTGRIDLAWTDNATTENEFRIERSTDSGTTFVEYDTVASNVVAYADTSTVEDTQYSYRVTACNAGGCSAFSNTASATTPPSAASGLTADSISSARIDLSWTDNSTYETEFRIQRSVSGSSFTDHDTVAADVSTYSDTIVSADTEYGYRVLACNTAGCATPATLVSVFTPPVAPTADSATAASDSRIDVRWTDNSATESSFRVERRTGTSAFVQVATQGASVTLYSDAGLSANTTYDYRIRACNSGGCSDYTDTLTATTLATPPPADPTGLSATLAGDQSSVSLSWTDNSTDEDEFRVERSIDGGTFTQRATLGANTQSFTDTDITVDNLYTYRVEACNSAGCSGFSNEASAVTEPVAPSALDATAVSAGQVDLTWTDASDTEDEFQLERSVDGGAFSALGTVQADTNAYSDLTTVEDTEYTYRLAACNTTGCSAFSATATDTTPPSAASGLTVTAVTDSSASLSWTDNSTYETEFRIQRRISGGYIEIDTVGAGVTAYDDSGLDPTTTYEYRIVACNTSGCASPSTSASATTQQIPAPSGLTTDIVSANQIDLSWTDNSTTETGFEIERSTDGGTTFSALATTLADATSYSDGSTVEDTEYLYRVRACDGSGCSAYSGEVTATTAPTAASGLTATAASDTQIDLAWADSSDTETGFEVWRGPAGGTLALITTTTANATGYSDTGLDPSTSYDYEVLACNDAGCAAPATATSTTQEIPAPSALTATAAADTTVALTWTDNSTTETEFRIDRSTDGGTIWADLTTVAADLEAYADQAAAVDTEYSYRIEACDGSTCSPFSAVATDTTPPSSAAGATITTVSDSAVDLSWTDASTYETEFRIERSTDGGTTFAALTTVGAGVTAHTDATVSPNTTYDYRIVACNSTGCADPSDTATTTTDPIPAPSGLGATVQSANQVDLAWTDNSTTETRFDIERSTDGGVTFDSIDATVADDNTYSDLTTVEDTEYIYRVRACNDDGCSAASNADTATTPPTAASAATTGAVTDSSVALSWTDNSSTETEFRIERRTGTDAFAEVGTVATDSTTYDDTTVSPNTAYDYRVLACNASGCAAPSNTATATTDPIPAPSNLAATAVSSTQIDLSWTDNSTTETSFEIERRPSGGTFAQIATVGTGVVDYSDTGLTADTTYEYQIRACNADGCSAYTAIASATTSPAT